MEIKNLTTTTTIFSHFALLHLCLPHFFNLSCPLFRQSSSILQLAFYSYIMSMYLFLYPENGTVQTYLCSTDLFAIRFFPLYISFIKSFQSSIQFCLPLRPPPPNGFYFGPTPPDTHVRTVAGSRPQSTYIYRVQSSVWRLPNY